MIKMPCMSKIFMWFLIFLGSPVWAISFLEEIQSDPNLRSAISIVARRSYGDASEIRNEVRLLPNQPDEGAALTKENSDFYFHDMASQVKNGYLNTFQTAGVKGCIYSGNFDALRKKVFIVFPGTQTSLEWAKNFFGIVAPFPHNNIQSSYDDDITILFNDQGIQSFKSVLFTHLNSINSNYTRNNNPDLLEGLNDFSFIFVGHSRGGGLALLAARRFKEQYAHQYPELSVKVATFCAPRLTNAPVEQVKFVSTLGFLDMVHFTRQFDLAPQFPFGYLDNFGVHIPLKSRKFWYPLESHKIPSTVELTNCVTNFNEARGTGTLNPFYNLTALEPKPILWAAGGALFMYYAMNVKFPSYKRALIWIFDNT